MQQNLVVANIILPVSFRGFTVVVPGLLYLLDLFFIRRSGRAFTNPDIFVTA